MNKSSIFVFLLVIAPPGRNDDNITQELTSGETLVYPEDPVREGNLFDGWDAEVMTVSEDTVITAKWKNLYTVTFKHDGGATKDDRLLKQTVVIFTNLCERATDRRAGLYYSL